MTAPTRLRPKMIVGLRWEETSGVDHPANEEEGWVVMKGKRMRKIEIDRPLLDMEVVTKNKEKQYTFSVVYKSTESKLDPELDAHHEYIMADELQEAQWGYVQTGDRTIYLQHGTQGLIKIGEYVDIVTWPYEVVAELTLPGRAQKAKTTIPAGSVWMGVLWNSTGWPLIKDGLLTGFSLGGFRKKQADVTKAKEQDMATLNKEFGNFMDELEQTLSPPRFRALAAILQRLTAADVGESNSLGAVSKARVPSSGELDKLIDHCRTLELDDDMIIKVIRHVTQRDNPEEVRARKAADEAGDLGGFMADLIERVKPGPGSRILSDVPEQRDPHSGLIS